MDAVFKYLAHHQDRFLQELCEYIRFPSVSTQPQHRQDLEACARWLAGHCRQIGLHTRVHPTPGHPIVTARTFKKRDTRRPHFLVYGHYDVQPVDPLALWKYPPFEPRVEKGRVRGRGASDNKGQHFAHLKALEAYLKTGTPLPCDVTFLAEGEEETGGDSLAGFLRRHREELTCDAVIVSDNNLPDLEHPALTYGLRGIAALEIRIDGPACDLHSGIHGGALENPALALCRILARLHDRQGRVTIPGFYDDVLPLTKAERENLARNPCHERDYRRFLGVPRLSGETGYTAFERRTARPTFEVNGLTSGYQGAGTKTIIPAWASAKITMRLVPDQKPERILRLAQRHLRKLCPPTVRMTFNPGHSGDPYWVSPHNPKVGAALAALRQAFDRPPLLLREGGSIPIVNDFKKMLEADTLLLGLALPDDNAHSPNEKFSVECFRRGMRLSACLWPELARHVKSGLGD
jgi:acetylornithine deacetylase/succinyl-diaminopimelate desuccinylase-like protein